MALAVIAALYVLLFAYYLSQTIITRPYWDMYSYIMRYLQYRDDGGWWAYLWDPHVQHRHVWMRLLTALDIEAWAGTGYPFVAFAAACHIGTAWLVWRVAGGLVKADTGRLGSPPAPGVGLRPMQWLAVMLVLTSVSAVSCAIPMNGIYPQTLFFTMANLVLFESPRTSGRALALSAAVAAAFANAAALALWPILLWSAWRRRLGAGWTTAVAVCGTAFIALYLFRLPSEALGAGGPELADISLPARIARSGEYFVTYLGLPLTRSSELLRLGQLVGLLLLVCSAALVVRRGLLAQTTSRADRLGVSLVLFALACATLAAVGRSEIDSDVIVPVRYSVLVTPLHLGLLLLGWPRAREWAAGVGARVQGVRAVALALAVVMLGQQIVAGQAAIATTRSMRAVLARFAAGEETAEMRRVVFVNLEQARRQSDRIRREGLYLNAR